FESAPDTAGSSLPVEADVRLDDRDDPACVARDLEHFEPCGESNRAPRVFLPDAQVLAARSVKGHLKLELRVDRASIAAFGFELGDLASRLAGARAAVVGRLRRDAWRGGDAVEIRIDRIASGRRLS